MLPSTVLPFSIFCLTMCMITSSGLTDANTEKYLAAAEKYILYHRNMVDAFKGAMDGVKHLATFAKAFAVIGPVLQAVSVIFSFAQMFIEKPDSQELIEIRKGFKEMHERFNKLEVLIEDLKATTYFAVLASAYQDRHIKIMTATETLAGLHTTAGVQTLLGFCNTNQNGMELLNYIYRNFVQKNQLPMFYQAIFNMTKYDLKGLQSWFGLILLDAGTAAEIVQACLGVRNETLEETNKKAIENQKKLQEIVQVCEQAEATVKTDFFHKQLYADAMDQLGKHENKDHEAFAVILWQVLRQKYFWLSWQVISYNELHGYEVHTLTCFGNQCLGIFRQHKRNLYIAWCDMTVPPRLKYDVDEYKNQLLRLCRDRKDEKEALCVALATAKVMQRFGAFASEDKASSYADINAYIIRSMRDTKFSYWNEHTRPCWKRHAAEILKWFRNKDSIVNSAWRAVITIKERSGVIAAESNVSCFVDYGTLCDHHPDFEIDGFHTFFTL